MKKKVTKTKHFSPFTAVVSVLSIILVCFVLHGYISLNELTLRSVEMKNEVERLESSNSVLEVRIDRKNSLGNIEEIATEQLGMVKLESYQIHTVNLAVDDTVEVVKSDNERGFFDDIVASFNILVEYLN